MEQTEIRGNPHKIINGLAILLTQEEIAQELHNSESNKLSSLISLKESKLEQLRKERDIKLAKLDIISLRTLENKAALSKVGLASSQNIDASISEIICQKERLRHCTDALKNLEIFNSYNYEEMKQKIIELSVLNFDPLENLKQI